MLIGIIGFGFVGRATGLLKNNNINEIIYDINPNLCYPSGTTLYDLESCDLIFICLPTPMNHNGNCYTEILKDTISKIKNPFKIIRSTVPIGYTDSCDCFFMPEFLTELNWKEDFINTKTWLIGFNDKNEQITTQFKNRVQTLFELAKAGGNIKSDKIIFTKNKVAESIKIVKNCFLSAKVGIMNEIYDLCKKEDVDYEELKEILKLDERIGSSHLNVPGYNNKRGFGGTCFPKDTLSLYNQYQNTNTPSILFQSVLFRNETIDRLEREWSTDYWRTVIPRNKPISLVTGGAGFLGSNLCRRLLYVGHIVICLDNFETGSMKNIKDLLDNTDFQLKNADIINKQFFPHLDFIWHLACPASPPKYQKDGYKTLQTSLIGTMNVLELVKTHKCPILFSSTSEIYGDPWEHPQKETYWGNVNTVGPRSCYDEGKRCAESLIYEYRKYVPDVQLKIVRIFNTFGPFMDIDDGRVITNYMKAYLNNKPVPIYGDGMQTRSFCYVDDLIDGFMQMMTSNEIGPINLGNPHEFNMLELKNIFDNLFKKQQSLEYFPLPINDPKQRKPDITLAKEKLNWQPKIKIEEGIEKTIEHFDYTKKTFKMIE